MRQVALEIWAPPSPVHTHYVYSPCKKKLTIFLPLPQCQPDWVQADGVHRGYSFIFGHAGLSIFKHFPPIWNPLRAGLFHPFGNHANDIAKLAKKLKSSLCFSPSAKWTSSIACFESFNFPNGGNKNKENLRPTMGAAFAFLYLPATTCCIFFFKNRLGLANGLVFMGAGRTFCFASNKTF